MPFLEPKALVDILEWRYAVKAFDPKRLLSDAIWTSLERALVLTPSSYGLQPWKFFVVRNQALREKLRAASWNQKQVTDCSHYVVLAPRIELDETYVDSYLQSIAQTRGIPVESLAGLRKSIVGDVVHGTRSKQIAEWATRQVYIALGNLMTSAAALGVDSCPMEGLEPDKYDELLGLKPTPYRVAVACALGYRSAEDKFASFKKTRFPHDQIIQHL